MDNSPKFDFYEVVVIASAKPELVGIAGRRGAVLARAQADDSSWTYAIHLLPTGDTQSIDEADLKSTGERMCRDDFFDGSSVAISVDRNTREGRLSADQ